MTSSLSYTHIQIFHNFKEHMHIGIPKHKTIYYYINIRILSSMHIQAFQTFGKYKHTCISKHVKQMTS
jgi:hypothetical protein